MSPRANFVLGAMQFLKALLQQIARALVDVVVFVFKAALSGLEYLLMRGFTFRFGVQKDEAGKRQLWSRFVVNGIEDEASGGGTVNVRREDDRPYSFGRGY
jgi:hypothetical protein